MLITYVHYYVIDLSTKKKRKDGGSFFTNIKNTDGRKYKTKIVQLFHFRNSLFFLYALFQKKFNVLSEHSFKRKLTHKISIAAKFEFRPCLKEKYQND